MKPQEEITLNYIFELIMQKKWDEVIKIYKNHPWDRSAKLIKSEETTLHVAFSSYNPKSMSSDRGHIKKMIEYIPEEGVCSVMSMKNEKWNTPLHLVAAVGWEAICEFIASKGRDLISKKNKNNETHFFVAAHHGQMQALLCLHDIYDKDRVGQEPDE